MFFVSAKFTPILCAKHTIVYLMLLCFSILGAQETSFFVSLGTKISGAENVFVASQPTEQHATETTPKIIEIVWVEESTPKANKKSTSLASNKKLEADSSFLKDNKQNKSSLYNQSPFAGTPEADFIIGQNGFAAIPSTTIVSKNISTPIEYNQAIVFAKNKTRMGFVYNSPVVESFFVDFYLKRPPPA